MKELSNCTTIIPIECLEVSIVRTTTIFFIFKEHIREYIWNTVIIISRRAYFDSKFLKMAEKNKTFETVYSFEITIFHNTDSFIPFSRT